MYNYSCITQQPIPDGGAGGRVCGRVCGRDGGVGGRAGGRGGGVGVAGGCDGGGHGAPVAILAYQSHGELQVSSVVLSSHPAASGPQHFPDGGAGADSCASCPSTSPLSVQKSCPI